MNLQLSKNFTLEEFTRSEKARKLRISNVPSAEDIRRIRQLVNDILQPLRDEWGSGIKITSGYRCAALNKAVGGAATSVHKIGYAADIVPCNGKMEEFREFVKDFLQTRNFDQLIDERRFKNGKLSSTWLHIGLKNNSGLQRRQVFNKLKGEK